MDGEDLFGDATKKCFQILSLNDPKSFSLKAADPSLRDCANKLDALIKFTDSSYFMRELFDIFLFSALALFFYVMVWYLGRRERVFGFENKLFPVCRQLWSIFRKNMILWRDKKLKVFFTIIVPSIIAIPLVITSILVGGTDNNIYHQQRDDPFEYFSSLPVASHLKYNIQTSDLRYNMQGQIPEGRRQVFQRMTPTMGIYMVIVFIYPFSMSVSELVFEKAIRMKEFLKLSGVNAMVLLMGDLMARIITIFWSSLILAAVTKFGFVFGSQTLGDLFFFFMAIQMAFLALANLISVFFSQTRQAILFGFIVVVGTHFMFYTLSSAAMVKKGFSSILPSLALGFGINSIMEAVTTCVNPIQTRFFQLFSDREFDVTFYTGMLLFDFTFYLLLTLYLDAVVPQKYGSPKPWNFIFKKQFWLQLFTVSNRDKDVHDEALDSNLKCSSILEEPVDHGIIERETSKEQLLAKSKLLVSLKNLTKMFGKKTVVDGLTCKFYDGQITSLLGHNGAGKSTTFAMITGALSPNSGDVEIYGHSLKESLGEIRKIVGFCPQHNSVYESLTVRQNLELFAALKCVPLSQVSSRIESLCRDMNILDKLDYPSGSLSGGQKRKLCIGLCFIADTKFVILDEPTAGMDPLSRRQTWDLIKKNKQDRTILFTSHFLDEVDFLSDRVILMSHGKVHSSGSLSFLKSKLSRGYLLQFYLNNVSPDSLHKIHTIIYEHVADALESDDASCLSLNMQRYFLPISFINSFGPLLVALENEKDLVRDISLDPPSMEDVFLKVTGESCDPEPKINCQEMEMIKNLISSRKVKPGFIQHIKALFTKRLIIAKTDRKVLISITIIPIVFLLFLIVLPQISVYSIIYGASGTSTKIQYPACHENLLATKPSERSDKRYCFDYMYGFDQIESMKLELEKGKFRCKDRGRSEYHDYCRNFPAVCDVEKCNDETQVISPNYLCSVRSQSRNGFCPGETLARIQIMFNGLVQSLCVFMAFIFVPVLGGGHVVWEAEKLHNTKFQQFCSGVSSYSFWFATFLWDFCIMIFILVVTMVVLIIKLHTFPSYMADSWMTVCLSGGLLLLYILSVLPSTYRLSRFFSEHSKAISFFGVYNLVFGLALVIVFYVLDLVNFRIPGLGISSGAFAFYGRFLFNLSPSFALVDGILGISTIRAVKVDFYRNSDLTFSIFNARLSNDMDLKLLERVFFNAVYMLFIAIFSWIELLLLERQRSSKGDSGSRLKSELKVSKSKSPLPSPSSTPSHLDDENVRNEKSRILAQGPNNKEPISIQGLTKIFTKTGKVAVDDLWLGIPSSQCFGFLGVNGAGKTTTIQMLTGKITPSSGNAFVANVSIKDADKARSLIGYCPQFDALFDRMSVTDHLKFYASIRGVNHAFIIDYWVKRMNLEKFKSTAAGDLSGGNKRKLCVAIAMIGWPVVAYLDEPSTGLDAFSKRFLWKRIRQVIKDCGCSVMLTTHSMEECEALCPRVGILIDGKLQALGSVPYIKSEYGKSVNVEVNFSSSSSSSSSSALKNDFGKALSEFSRHSVSIQECHENRVVFAIHKKGQKSQEEEGSFCLGNLFIWMEEQVREFSISSYSIRNQSLEEIFNNFAQRQTSLNQ